MNIQLKTIILKETSVWKSRKYFTSLILNLGFFSIMVYIIIKQAFEIEAMRVLFIQFMFTFLPVFAMWILMMPMLLEKFRDDKLTKTFEAMLTAPVSLKTILLAKLISTFLLTYIALICTFIIMFIMWTLIGVDPLPILSNQIWLIALVIYPSYLMIYAAFSAWSILMFKQPKTTEILNAFGILIFIFTFIESDKIVQLIFSGSLINNSITLYLILGSIIGFCLIYILVNKLKKEKVTI
jgi:ABC-type Na+ efflux pump permease subunit